MLIVIAFLILEKTLGNVLVLLYKLIFCIEEEKPNLENVKSLEEERE